MNKIGLLFPGQGSQYVGMGREFYDNCPESTEIFDQANDILGFDLKKIIFDGPEEILRQTQYTQPAIFITSMAAFKSFSMIYELSTINYIGAGHSLGEYSALCAAGVFSFADGLRLVKARGKFIQQSSENNKGTMAAIIGLSRKQVEEVCAQATDAGVCKPVNFNSSEQIVIAGTTDSVNKAVAIAQRKGALKTVILNVSGPFHSSLMNQASVMMEQELTKYSLKPPLFPVITNCDANPTIDKTLIADKLVSQINHPVLWEDSVKKMIELGCEIFIEIGPQRVLSGLLRRIDKTKKSLNVEDNKSLEKTLEALTAASKQVSSK